MSQVTETCSSLTRLLFSGLVVVCSCSPTPTAVSPLPGAAVQADAGPSTPAAADLDAGRSAQITKDSDAGSPPDVGDQLTGVMVPNCNGEKIRTPYWLTRVHFGTALCVQASPVTSTQVDYGTNLIAVGEAGASGSDDNRHQVYYSLSQKQILPQQSRVVWAVCGGKGRSLPAGSDVLPAPRLLSQPVARISMLLMQVEALEAELDDAIERLSEPSVQSNPSKRVRALVRVERLKSAIDTEAGLLRDALITEHETTLIDAGLPKVQHVD